MRIALVAGEDPGWGGIGTYTGVLGHALAELGHDVVLVLRGWEEEAVESIDGLVVHRVNVPEPTWRRGTVAVASRLYGARESIVFSARAGAVLTRIGPDVVEAPEFGAPGLVPALRSRLRRGAPPAVLRLHAPSFVTARLAAEPADLDLRAGEALEAAAAHAARLITSPSAALAELVRARWRLGPDRIRVVPNPIDEALFTPLPGAADVDPGRILLVGRVERAKGHDVLVEALPAIRTVAPSAQVLSVGDDGGDREALERRAEALGVRGAISFSGAWERAKLPAAYRSAAVCVVPSRFEAFPYVALEAMACGCAVVAAAVGGLPEAIEHGVSGLLVAAEDPEALAAAVAGLLSDPDRRLALGRAARARVLSLYTARKVAERMAEIYAETCEGKRR